MWEPLVPVAAVLLLFAFFAWRFPVLLRMGLRNIGRRKAQSAIVVAGLMVGTAIISGSFVTADSLEYGITRGVYDALGPTDEFVQLDGNLFFPQEAYDTLAANRTLTSAVHGVAPYFLDTAAIRNPEAKLSEPRIAIVGFDPEAERRFEPFVLRDGTVTYGDELGETDVFLAGAVADKIDAVEGDTIRLSYSIIPQPLLPRIHNVTGTVTGASGCAPPGTLPMPSPLPCDALPGQGRPANGTAVSTFPVDRAAVRVVALVFPDFRNRTNEGPPPDFDLRIESPSGISWSNYNGTPNAPERFTMLNASMPEGERLERGNWTFEVSSKASAAEPFSASVIVLYETYDLNELRNFTEQFGGFGEALQERFSGGGSGGGGFGLNLHTANLTVRGVLKAEGKGDFLLQPGAFMRLGTAQRLYDREGRINLVGVSNTGHPENGVARSGEVSALFSEGLKALAASDPEEPSYKALKVQETKNQFLSRAALAGERFTQFLSVISTFTIIAGVMLIVNIFVMLAEERKSELGMARAVGLKRRQLLLLFSFEGLAYALVAAFIGVLLGLGIAWGLLYLFNNILAGLGDNGPRISQFPFHPETLSLTLAFAAGFFITLITVAFASNKVSKLNVVRAIRRIEEPEKREGYRLPLVGAGILALASLGTLAGFVWDVYALKVYAPAVALLGLGTFLARWVPRRLVYPVTGAAVAAFVGWTLFGIAQAEDTTSQILGVLRGVVLVLAVVLIVVYIPQMPRLLKRGLLFIKPMRAIAAPAVSYPLEKKTRTGLTVSMFALVILVVVVFSTLGSTFTIDLKRMSGGFDVSADSTAPIDDLRAFYEANVTDKPERNPFDSIERYESLTRASAQGAGDDMILINGQKIPRGNWGVTLYSYGPGFAESSEYEFRELDPRYPSPRDALNAVREDSSLIILESMYDADEAGNPGIYHPGDVLTLRTANGDVNFTIIGIMKNQFFGGLWVHEDVITANFQRIRGEYLFKLVPGADAIQVAKDLEAAFEVAGMDAESLEEAARLQQETTNRFLTLFQLFLAFGLVVGIASMGIITARNVIERRQEIGMLRAVGFPRRAIQRLFLSEVLFTTLLGILIGVAVGVFIAYAVVTTSLQDLDVEFSIPWLDISVILLVTAAVTVLCTFWPARKASLVPPAEAVRYIE